jgi:hypothetical protein
MSGWWAKAAGVSRPSRVPRRIWAAVRGEQVTSADDEVDALAQVVHDDSKSVCPVAVAVGQGRVAVVRDLVRAGPTSRSIQRSEPPPSAARRTGPSRSARAAAARAARSRASDARGPAPTPRTSCASNRSRRRARQREGAPARPRTGRRRSDCRIGRSSARKPSHSRSSSRAPRTPDGFRRGRGPRCATGPRPRPTPPSPRQDGVRDVTEMEVSGRRRGESRPRHSVRVVSGSPRDRSSAPAPAWRRTTAGTARADPPGRAGLRSRSSPRGAPRARARRP